MAGFEFVGTIVRGRVGNLTDLTVGKLGSQVVLLGATNLGGGITRWRVPGADAAARLEAVYDYPDKLKQGVDPHAVLLDRPGGGLTMFAGGLFGAVEVASIVRPDAQVTDKDLPLIRSHLPRDLMDAGSFSDAAGRPFVWTTQAGSTHLTVWKQALDGSLIARPSAAAPPGIPRDSQIDGVATLRMGGTELILSVSTRGNFVGAHTVSPDGQLSPGTFIGSTRGTGFNGPRDIAAIEVEGKYYAIVSSAFSSSLTTIRILPGGKMVPVDQVIDERTTRFQAATVMETVRIEGRTYVVAGGADDGLSLFTVTPDGRIVHLDTIVDDKKTALQSVSALAVGVIDGKIVVFAASATEKGVSQFVIDPGRIGQTRHVGEGASFGTDRNDLIQGGLNTTRIEGGAGDDILIGGTRPLSMSGGRGADIFLPTPVAGVVTIKDFEPGTDRLDLSMMGMVRSTYQLRFVQQSWGITIHAGHTRIDVHRSGGGRLDAGLFTDAMFPIAHYQPPDVRTTILGTAAADVLRAAEGGSFIYGFTGNDTIVGSALEDYILGGAGHDRIAGGDGEDTIWGGDGNDFIQAGGMNDTVLAGNDHDIVMGEGGDDLIAGQAGNDIIFGGTGNDRVNAGAGDDYLAGEDGDDRLFGFAGNDRLIGGGGNDIMLDLDGDNVFRDSSGDNMMFGGAGRDRMFGGSGRDTMRSGAGNDFLAGGAGNDNMVSSAGDDIVLGEAGDDLILGVGGRDWLHGGAGNDTLWGGADDDRLAGSDGADVLMGEGGNDVALGGEGNDTARGHAGNDKLFMGNGNDRALGGTGNDTVAGDDGNDTLLGEGGNDVLVGGAGNDVVDGGWDDDNIWGNGGDDRLLGGGGNDRLRGGMGNDTLSGGDGADSLNGQAGDDQIAGDAGDDVLMGDWGRDTLQGGDGNDTLSGGGDDDLLIGGSGADQLIGGDGADVFAFLPADDAQGLPDTIVDFAHGKDRIDLSALDLGDDPFGSSGGVPKLTWRADAGGMLVQVDVNGDRAADLLLWVEGAATLERGDFIV